MSTVSVLVMPSGTKIRAFTRSRYDMPVSRPRISASSPKPKFEYSYAAPGARAGFIVLTASQSFFSSKSVYGSAGFAGVKFAGIRGKPERCVAMSPSSIGRSPTWASGTPSGRYFCTGSASFNLPPRTSSASSAAVNVFVIEPISNTVPSSGGLPVSFDATPKPRIAVSLPST